MQRTYDEDVSAHACNVIMTISMSTSFGFRRNCSLNHIYGTTSSVASSMAVNRGKVDEPSQFSLSFSRFWLDFSRVSAQFFFLFFSVFWPFFLCRRGHSDPLAPMLTTPLRTTRHTLMIPSSNDLRFLGFELTRRCLVKDKKKRFMASAA